MPSIILKTRELNKILECLAERQGERNIAELVARRKALRNKFGEKMRGKNEVWTGGGK